MLIDDDRADCEAIVPPESLMVHPLLQLPLTGTTETLRLRFTASERARVRSLTSSKAAERADIDPITLLKLGAASPANTPTITITIINSTKVKPWAARVLLYRRKVITPHQQPDLPALLPPV